MNFPMLFRLLAFLAAILGGVQLALGAAGAAFGNPFSPWAWSGGISLTAAIVLGILGRRAQPALIARDGFLMVTMGWALASILGALPYWFDGHLTWINALFESTSGFTTTGATVLVDIELLPASILVWRSFTQWFGGIGILLLAVAILPFLGVGGLQLVKAELPGPSKERLAPRLVTASRLLFGIYAGLTLVAAIGYWLLGMSWFDAVNHALTSLSTGGFSTRNASLAAYGPAIQWWAVFAMMLGASNFLFHFRLLTRRDWTVAKEPEAKLFFGIILGSALFMVPFLMGQNGMGLEPALRAAMFQVTAIMTTTGFASADYEFWAPGLQLLLLMVMFPGGMSGSTSGGFKLVRVAVLGQVLSSVWAKLLQPRRVVALTLGGRPIHRDVVEGCMGLAALTLLLISGLSLLLTLLGLDPLSAISAAFSAVGNVGPGLGQLGPTDNYAFLDPISKLALMLGMAAGRLEVFTVMVLFLPRFWKP